MKLKRIYDQNNQLDHIQIMGAKAEQRFSQKLINQGIEEGFLSLGKGLIVFHTVPQMTYRIIGTPGLYCCFDENKMGDTAEAKDYIAKYYSDQISPDRQHPSGYRFDHFYTGQLLEENING